jgi:MOSC domain-containing protein YiiM
MHNSKGEVLSVNIGSEKGKKKTPVLKSRAIENQGLAGDAHAGAEKRQVSLLAVESFEKIREKGLDVSFGDFAENLTTRGIDLPALPIGTKIRIGRDVILEISQIGKVCHDRCHIYHTVGDCVMPREGIFGIVIKGGEILPGDSICRLED